MRILLVQNSRVMAHNLIRALRAVHEAAEIDWVVEGEQGLDRLAHWPYALVVSDHLLRSKLTGIDVWKSVQSLAPAPAFVLIGGDGLDRVPASDIPPRVIRRPFQFSQFKELVRTISLAGPAV
jgi:DNA-binding response OmpR family regulator